MVQDKSATDFTLQKTEKLNSELSGGYKQPGSFD